MNKQSRTASDLGRYAGLGIQFTAAVLLFAWLGYWLDGVLGTRPWLLIAGVFVGATGGFLAMLRAVPPARRPRRKSDTSA